MLPLGLHSKDHRKHQNVVRKSVKHSAVPYALFFFKTHFDVICDMSLNRHMATWNLIVKLME